MTWVRDWVRSVGWDVVGDRLKNWFVGEWTRLVMVSDLSRKRIGIRIRIYLMLGIARPRVSPLHHKGFNRS